MDTFNAVWITQPLHDFSSLRFHTQSLKFLSDGQETLDDLPRQFVDRLAEFNPETDAIVCVGRSTANALVGAALAKLFPGTVVTFGVFRSWEPDQRKYVWMEVLV